MAQPQQLATVGTGRDERTCRIGMLFGNFVKRVCTVGWALVGLIVAAMVAQGTRRRRCSDDPGERVRVRLPAAAVSRRARAADRVDPRREHVDVLGLSGRQRGAVHRRAVSASAWCRTGRIGTICGSGASAGSPSRCSACCMRSSSIQSVLYTFLLTETLATFVGISVLGGIVWRARQPVGRAGEPAGRAGDEFPALLPDGPAPGSLGPERVSRRARRRHRGAGRREPADARPSRRPASSRSSSGCRRRATTTGRRRPRPLLLVNVLHPAPGGRRPRLARVSRGSRRLRVRLGARHHACCRHWLVVGEVTELPSTSITIQHIHLED